MGNRTLDLYSDAEGGENITTSIDTGDNLRFKESFIVAGGVINAGDVYANYDLRVIGDLHAESVTVLGNLYVSGDILVKRLVCSKNVTCEGIIDANEIIVDDLIFSESIACKSLTAHDVIVKESVDVEGEIDIKETVYAADGLIGEGSLIAKKVITMNYLDFSGDLDCSVVDLSEDILAKNDQIKVCSSNDDSISVVIKNKIKELYELEEDEFVQRIKELGEEIPDFKTTIFLIDRIIELTYKSKIESLTDYLIAYWAMQEFPNEVQEYDTLKLVFNNLMNAAKPHLSELPFNPTELDDVVYCLFVISKFQDQFKDNYSELADKILKRIGLRYNTVLQLLNL